MMRRVSNVYKKAGLAGLYAIYECSICRKKSEMQLPNHNCFCTQCKKKIKNKIKKKYNKDNSKLKSKWLQLMNSKENLFRDWKNFEIFKYWALHNGWNENKNQILKRIDKSIGYFPGNIKIKNEE